MFSRTIICLCLAVATASSYHQEFLSAPLFSAAKAYRHMDQYPEAFENYFHPFAVPRDDDEDVLEKNLQIVVIDGPDSKRISSALVQLARTLADGRTAIYLVNKDTDFKKIFIDGPDSKTVSDFQPKGDFSTGKPGEGKAEMGPTKLEVGFYSNVANETKLTGSNPVDNQPLISRPVAIATKTDEQAPPSDTTVLAPVQQEANATVSGVYLPPDNSSASAAGKEAPEPLFGFYLPPPESVSVSRTYLPPDSDVRIKSRQ